jgi:hypothetical protein
MRRRELVLLLTGAMMTARILRAAAGDAGARLSILARADEVIE